MDWGCNQGSTLTKDSYFGVSVIQIDWNIFVQYENIFPIDDDHWRSSNNNHDDSSVIIYYWFMFTM